ncbi:adenylate cyclase, class 3 [Terrimicrobium sacchariphilum]|jgi:class 3 adenylate cyclase|uniref:Adenylate cyclase, class 3 n=1 Tax=Terrimicrobium sacchariphilum TaxID=690879 RepID=A0A146GEX7_TERSA|nr:adenylate/guanylate cyclase domain-containing protein [Terrimicrobium sacchariphilum]GAT35028.1 adenylate cyclase, class 3 [Terrimicrobium sacchariphilum]
MRYLKATILIGTISTAIVTVLFAAGWVSTTPDLILDKIYALKHATTVPVLAQILLMAFFSYAIAWTTVDITRPSLKTVVAVATILLLLTGSKVLSLYNVFFSPFPSVFAVLIAYIVGLIYGRSGSGSRKKILERLFGQRISRSVFNQLVNGYEPVSFPGALAEGTVIVCEVQNHRELMELLSPEDYAAMTNLYLQTASDYLVEVGGYLDECTGESLRVVFGTPLPDEKHASRACRAALDLMIRLDNLNRECDATWQRRFDFRIGVNSGEMIAAAYGGSRLANFSVAGPAVEFARRLCAACATYGCRILVGPETFEQASDTFEARPIEVLKAAGERRRVELYEILAPKHSLSPERERSRDHFWRGVIYVRDKKWEKAIEEFSKARITGIPDPALDYYIQRVERSRRGEDESAKDEMSLFGA